MTPPDTPGAPERRDQRGADDPPPFLGGRWSNVYLLVLGELAVLVAIFYVLTRWAS